MTEQENNEQRTNQEPEGAAERSSEGEGSISASSEEVRDHVWKALRECYDPEIPVNIVDLGLVYEVAVDDAITGEANVFVKMTLTAPGCGMGPMIAADVRRRVQQVRGVQNVIVDLVAPIATPVRPVFGAVRTHLSPKSTGRAQRIPTHQP